MGIQDLLFNFEKLSNEHYHMQKVISTICVAVLFCSLAIGQTSFPEQGLSFKRTFIDYLSQNSGTFGDFKNYNSGFEIGYLRGFTENIEGYIPLRLGVIKLTDELNVNNAVLAELDLQARYWFYRGKKVNPYALAGVGVVSEGLDNFNAQIPLGIGLDFRIAPSSFINLQGEYRVSLAEKRNNIQFGFGFSHYLDKGDSYDDKIGKETDEMKGKDSDGDGITDDLDLCPQLAGLQAFAGCPDSDGDGIEDSRDQCPKLAGLRSLNGCPDSDGDGVSDNDDECPNLAGLAGNNGCPGEDSDHDGVPDDKDECPNLPGSISTLGCPDSDGDGVIDKRDLCPNNPGPTPRGCPDTDGDGLDDSEDRCPNQVGSAENKGCPELNVQEQELLRIAMRDVKFDHSKATLRSESFGILNQIYDLMEKYPGYKLKVGGHTDNTGSLTINQRLSGQRAKACYDYLQNKGIPSSRISYSGYGPDRPIADNSTQQGRALNRRVEFELIIE